MTSEVGLGDIFEEIESTLSNAKAKFDTSNNAHKERSLTPHEVNVANIILESSGVPTASTIDIQWESLTERDPSTMEVSVFEEASIHHSKGRMTLMFILRREQDKPLVGKKFTLVDEAGLIERPYDNPMDFLAQQKIDQQFNAISDKTDTKAISSTEIFALHSLLKTLRNS